MCVCAQLPRIGMSQGKYGPHGELLFFLIQMKPVMVPSSEAFNSFIRDGFQLQELKGGSEASDGHQAGNVNNEALQVIGIEWIW